MKKILFIGVVVMLLCLSGVAGAEDHILTSINLEISDLNNTAENNYLAKAECAKHNYHTGPFCLVLKINRIDQKGNEATVYFRYLYHDESSKPVVLEGSTNLVRLDSGEWYGKEIQRYIYKQK